MPPHVPRKRLRTPSPVTSGRITKSAAKGKVKASPATAPPPPKTTHFEDSESGVRKRSAEKTRLALQQMYDNDDASSSLSSLSDIEFEDVPPAKRQRLEKDSDSEDEDEQMEFEDVPNLEPQAEPVVSGDLSISWNQGHYVPLSSDMGKKSATKKEKAARIVTHCMHVQLLLWHNAVRNSWLCDVEVQAIMISHLPPRLWDEVDRWRLSSGLDDPEEVGPKKGKPNRKTRSKGKQPAARPTRDWSDAADRLEKGVPDMSRGDPLFRLLKALCPWWRQRFRITAPGLRKIGYMSARRLGKWSREYEEGEHDPEKFGERITNLEEFRKRAQECTGSRDVGAQLFTALLRGIGLEARMVANLQSIGFGWSKAEEANEEKPENQGQKAGTNATDTPNGYETSKKTVLKRPAKQRAKKSEKDALMIELDDSDEFADPLSEESDDDSIVDVTAEHRQPRTVTKLYDKDLDFPHYWTEVLSPVTKTCIPVDPIVKSVVGTNRELIESLEPRGGKADKAKQIIAYVVGFSQDGTAKDVTVRYLRKRLFPGRTKGARMGVEKIPIYNKHGKVKRYEQFDWFGSVMRGYSRGGQKHPITEADELEDSTDLKPAVPEKKEVKEGEETLQYYKSSKEFVLARHLKREEALLPTAKPVKVFRNKGKGGKVDEEDVFSRKDVVAVKSAETWHKQGRAPKDGEAPLKHAPYRAATTNRRRELAEAEARTGGKVLQPLYSYEQTDWIIPDPIVDGQIPKNEYGNIDMFAEHMCPEGAVHLPYRGAVRVCKRLEIDYAEAVVGFEFGHRMAVPVIQGVVVAEEHRERVIEEIEKDEAERARKEDEKRRKAVLGMWRKMLMGLRIAKRIQDDYGHIEDMEVDGHDGGGEADFRAMQERDEDMAGGFLPEGYEEEDAEEPEQKSGYFPVAHEDDEDPFEVEDGLQEQAGVSTEPAPDGRKMVVKPKPKAKPKMRTSTRRRTRRTQVESSEEDDQEEDDDFMEDGDD
ncbi:Rad4 transglutaminase-like domain-containing protein [Pseudomassariella vexata]|uniref:Rad4 transglutaminase-like domain-domain-containing protein n=1 Tax=Pseudomassariella vexata TaxID=1141098 RepID=A0A1Y2DFX2_9PEZI|nr:Rad4 transglutaminase-like domain-containing protein [Pseudomassariella vexata]ORY58158.1 Rad4 transglutaminase-like domain-domain-containing protein [Pseudomassariella vexata]